MSWQPDGWQPVGWQPDGWQPDEAAAPGTDDVPDPFVFATQSAVPVGVVITSPPAVITGIDIPSPWSVDIGQVSINGGTWDSAGGNVNVLDSIRLRHTSSALNSTAVVQTLTVGGVVGTFTSITAALAVPGDYNSGVVGDEQGVSGAYVVSAVVGPLGVSTVN
jgi:hypothetical protein